MYLPYAQTGGQVLQFAAAVLGADEAVLGMIRENQLEDGPAGVDDSHSVGVHHHSGGADRRAGGGQVPAALNLHHADAAAARTVLYSEVIQFHVAESRDIYSHLPGSLEYRRPVFNLDLSVVYSKFNFIHLSYDY